MASYSLRLMTVSDLSKLASVNLDSYTETYPYKFYLDYLTTWPESCVVVEAADGNIIGYIIGKVEGTGSDWHGHVTALSVSPDFRRTGVATKMMDYIEDLHERCFKCNYMDLFVRKSNIGAVHIYTQRNYRVWTIVKEYYTEDREDALDMRKILRNGMNISSISNFSDYEIKKHDVKCET